MEQMLLASKIVSMLCLGLVTWIIGIVPMISVRRGWLSKKESDANPRVTMILSCLMCFGGGVIMTSSLCHMLPDVQEVLEISLEHGTFPDTGLPIAEILVLAGFLFIYTLEELMHMVLVCTGQLEGHGHEGHGHTHENIEVPIEESIQATARGFLIVLALSIHDFFEGIALGVETSTTATYFLLAAFASHKVVISGTVGLNWARSQLNPLVAVLYMTVFCGISPVGIGAGLALKEASENGGATLLVFQGLATGSLLYVVFFEILEKERSKSINGFAQAMSMTLGYIFMVLLSLLEANSGAEEGEGTTMFPAILNTTTMTIH